MPRLIVDLNFDPPRLVTEYTERDRAMAKSARKTKEGASTMPATNVAAEGPMPIGDPLQAHDDTVAYAKGLTLPEIKAFCEKNSLGVKFDAPNGGVAKMRAMNAIRAALKGGKVLRK